MSAVQDFFQALIFQAPWVERVGWTLLHSLWQLAIVGALYALVSDILKKATAQVCYLVACVALIAMMCFPVGTYLFLGDTDDMGLRDSLLSAGVGDKPVAMMSELSVMSEVPTSETLVIAPIDETPAIKVDSITEFDEILHVPIAFSARLRPLMPWITVGWLLGIFLLSMRPILGLLHVRRLQRHGISPLPASLRKAAKRLAHRLGVKQTVEFMQSRLIEVPIVAGYLRPYVLLPVAVVMGLSIAEIELIITHELAHIRRHDYLINLIQTAIETLLFFHPAVWWVSGCIRKEREHCCDDLAVKVCGDRVAYARTLARLEEERQVMPVTIMAVSGGSLIERIRRLIGHTTVVRTPRNIWLAGVMITLSLCIGLSLVMTACSGNPDDFDLKNPPGTYEKGVRMAKPDHSIKVGGLRFQLSELTESDDGFLQADLGIADGFEVEQFRLFDHKTRKQFHGSDRQRPRQRSLQFFVERVGATERIRMKEAGGIFPDKIDIWLRLIENRPGETLVLADKVGSSVMVGKSKIVLVSLFKGVMNGETGPTGDFVWDSATLYDEECRTTVELHNQEVPLQGNYAVVAVTKEGQRHAKYFGDFSKVGREPFTLDIFRKDIDHLELVPVQTVHKFFFNGVKVPNSPESTDEDVNIDAVNTLSIVSTSGQPVAGARAKFLKHVLIDSSVGKFVTVGEFESDAHGKVTIPDVDDPEVKSLRLSVEADGYVSRDSCHSQDLNKNPNGEWFVGVNDALRNRTIVLLRGSVVTGRVLGPDGKPLAGAPLSMTTECDYEDYWRGDGASPNRTGYMVSNHLRAISDENGDFRFEGVPAGQLLIYYPWEGPIQGEVDSGRWKQWTKPGQKYPQPPVIDRAWGKAITLTEGERRDVIIVDLSKSTAQVAGQVFDGAGNPVEGASVRAVSRLENVSNLSWPDSFSGGHAKTDSEGCFLLSGLPPGKIGILAKHELLTPPKQAVEIELQSGKKTPVKLTLTGTLPVVGDYISYDKDPDLMKALQFDREWAYEKNKKNADRDKAVEYYLKYLKKENIPSLQRARVYVQLAIQYTTLSDPQKGYERDPNKAESYLDEALKLAPTRISRTTIRARTLRCSLGLYSREETFNKQIEVYEWLLSIDEAAIEKRAFPIKLRISIRNLINGVKHSTAINAVAIAKMLPDGEVRLRKLVEDYPGTAIAEEALKRLPMQNNQDNPLESVPHLLEKYPSSMFVSGLLFDAWRNGLLTPKQKQRVAEGAITSVAFEDRITAFPEGTREVTLDIKGGFMEKDWDPVRTPHVPWDILDAKVGADIDRMSVEILGGVEGSKTQCSNEHFLRLPRDLKPGNYVLNVNVGFSEKNGDWKGRVKRQVALVIMPPPEMFREKLEVIIRRIGELKDDYPELTKFNANEIIVNMVSLPANPYHLGFEYNHNFDGWDNSSRQPKISDGGCHINVRFASRDNPSAMSAISLPRFGDLEARYLVVAPKGQRGEKLRQAVTEIIKQAFGRRWTRKNMPMWGVPDKGVRLSLANIKTIAGRSDWEHPVLQLSYEAWNAGSYFLHLPENGLAHQVEVDGQWYEWVEPPGKAYVSKRGGILLDFGPTARWSRGIDLAGNWRAIPKDKEQEYATRRYGGGWLVDNEDHGKELVLTQGKHKICVAIICPSARAPFHGVIRAVSYSKEVVVKTPAAEKSSALTEYAGISPYMLPILEAMKQDVLKLAEKYPQLKLAEKVEVKQDGLTRALQETVRRTYEKIGPLNRQALADSLPDTVEQERDRLLAEADAKIRNGILELAKTYPLLKKGQSWERMHKSSKPGGIGIHCRRQKQGKGRTDAKPFPPEEAFSVLVAIIQPPDSPEQLALFPSYPRLGLVSQVHTSAAEPKLNKALKKLVADALAPLAELEKQSSMN